MDSGDKRQTETVQSTESDLSEQIKTATKESHVRAENTQLMQSFQKGQITLPQYKLLLFSLYEIYNALEEELDRNASHPSVAPIYFPQELARLESLKKDLAHFYGQNWRERVIVPAATQRYSQRLRQLGKENPEYLVAHAYTRYLGDLSGGQVLGRITQKSLGLMNGEGLSFFSFPGVSSPNRFKQLYRSRMNSIELTEEERKGLLEEAVRAFQLNIEVFDDLLKMQIAAEPEAGVRQRHGVQNNNMALETDKNHPKEDVQISGSDLSEQIKAATKENHVRAENTELMLSFQRGQITLPQYKLLLFSLYEIYNTLEEELDRNASHPSVAPIYFPQELARLESLKKDLAHFYGQNWRERVIVPAATQRYSQRLRQLGKENPEYLVAHAYTRYLGDLSGGQVLGRITQKSLGLMNGEGLSFFSFPGVSSPNRFKQLYRSRMNSIELTEEERKGLLEEAVRAFQLNIEVFDDLQKILSFTESRPDVHHKHSTLNTSGGNLRTQAPSSLVPSSLLRLILGICVALATVGLGIYGF
ncbi:heme oxygenase 1a [Brienomyrus brachyistius]|uniref:heme oxygenase 1a n=1 Tax=Brienomyrus brachyistius TaxID=42636 RepID=UPI0020B17D43|nr:heme oxygenase 1a [Brienomyrus brachyistius]XP_048869954.1 heme oxygenase 1a [Brienomyrus brachyistius]